MKTKIFILTILLTAVCTFSFSSAQVPQMINYQGKLTTPEGALVNDTVQMTFSIYPDTLGSPAVWTETQNNVIVKEGIFSVLLGSVDSVPASVFDGSVKYLGVQVESDPEMRPLKPMVSVAYAYKSLQADTADYARAGAGGAGDNDWVFPTSAGGTNPRPYLYTYDAWGIARYGNILYGNEDSTHVNLGVACITGTNEQNYKYCTVGGGAVNTAGGENATVAGGLSNTASNNGATVGGGAVNSASGFSATVGGGSLNTASGPRATVGGGTGNTASGGSATVPGGYQNTAGADFSFAAGKRAKAYHPGSFVWADNTEADFVSTGDNQFLIRASGNVGIGTTTPSQRLDVAGTVQMTGLKMPTGATNNYVLTCDASGVGTWQPAVSGADNDWAFRITDTADTSLITGGTWGIARYGSTLYGNADSTHVNLGVACTTGTSGENYKYCTVGGGRENAASGPNATVGGGWFNIASGSSATVGGGYFNLATDIYATVGGGRVNIASEYCATVGGGKSNVASGDSSSVGGGARNTASGSCATIGGGNNNTADGDYAFVGGGLDNEVSYTYAAVSGGYSNTANGAYASIGGGASNLASGAGATVGGGNSDTASGSKATVGGGWSNKASGDWSTVGGGQNNIASGRWSTVGGGYFNTSLGDYSFAAGQRAKANHDGCFVWADKLGSDFASTAENQFLIRASGGVGIYNTSNTQVVKFLTTETGTDGAQVFLYEADGTATIDIDAQSGSNGGAYVSLRDSSGSITIEIDAQEGADEGGILKMYEDDGTKTVHIDAQGVTYGGAQVSLIDHDGTTTISLDAESGESNGGAFVSMQDGVGTKTIHMDANGASGGAQVSLIDHDSTTTISFDAESGVNGGANVSLATGAGVTTIRLDADYNATGEGRVITSVLEITGGSDLSEQFEIRTDRAEIVASPGMVVCIDPDHPGELVVSRKAYDSRVAGIISGAGGIKPGMLMGQAGSVSDGQYAVALTGRVYCLVDALYGPIRPGDLLTTSDTPGHAMKVTDYARAQGAIIGKAMSSLEDGQGLVLVLVSLQ